MVLLKSLLLIIDFFIFYTIISEVVVEYKKQKREVLHMKKFAMSILAICILLTPVSALGLPILPIEADRITTAVQRKGLSILGGKILRLIKTGQYEVMCITNFMPIFGGILA